jgi:hypothetical protein
MASTTARRTAAEEVAATLSTAASYASSTPGVTIEYLEVDFDTLEIDPSIQRDEERDEINRIVREFNPDALGVVTVSVRDVANPSTGKPEAHWFLVDGQQRRAACREVQYQGKLRALVYRGLSKDQEAQLFLDLNDRKGVGPWSKFKARLEAGEEQALAIQLILDELEIPVGAPDGFMAIAKADSIFKAGERGPANLRFALTILRDVYGEYNARILGGLAYLYNECHQFLDEELLRSKLSEYASSPLQVVRSANTLKATYGGRADIVYAEALANFYNRKMRRNSARSKALPSFYLGRKFRPTGSDLDELAIRRAEALEEADRDDEFADEA